jgi:anti-sigma factor ChrR (cupin superfamily)
MVEVLASELTSWSDESQGHRPKNQRKQYFGVTHQETGFHVQCNHLFVEKGGSSPRHRHNSEEARYVLEGHQSYGNTKCGPGTFIYIGESVYYGPQSRDEDTRLLIFQFPGPSGIPKFTASEIKQGRNKLLTQGVVFQKGIAHFPSGKKQDSIEAIWECLAGRPIEYAPPRYEDPIYFHSQSVSWQPTGSDGISIKHLGYFNECGPNVDLLRLEPGASMARGHVSCLEMRIVIDGEVEYGGQNCPAISRIYCPPDAYYDETVSHSGATLFVFQIAVPGGAGPKRESIG